MSNRTPRMSPRELRVSPIDGLAKGDIPLNRSPTAAARAGYWAAGIIGILAVAALDYVTGTEVRVYPLYFAPVALLAWQFRKSGLLIAVFVGTSAWLVVNRLSGMRFSSDTIWATNTAVHAAALLVVGSLVTALHQALEVARQIGRIDPLTQLRNSRAFYEDTKVLLDECRRTAQPVTAAYVDLDNFKSVNDVHGHQAGDAVLRKVGDAICNSVSPEVVCARLGGDEFAIVLGNVTEREAAPILEQLRQAVNEALSDPIVHATVSIGSVTFLEAPDDIEDLIQRADSVMYRSKAAGRNRVMTQVVDDATQSSPSSGGSSSIRTVRPGSIHDGEEAVRASGDGKAPL